MTTQSCSSSNNHNGKTERFSNVSDILQSYSAQVLRASNM